jgi:hypothetical protein
MEHPLIGDLSKLTLDELGEKIADLHQKLGMAMRTGNGHLCNQIRMAIESHSVKYQEKLQESYKKSNIDFGHKIKIQIGRASCRERVYRMV